ncbi:MAG: acyl-CoA dehydrogenase family protein [Thermoflexales bacterium]|nr:acyl-CoA dehydrogenase family protein [Thermoflexales bacterium]
MADNFFLDNLDLQHHLEQIDLNQVVALKEKGYTHCAQYPAAPRSYADAKDNYRLLLEVLGEVCATLIAPRAAEADEEGAQFQAGQVRYAAATQEAVEAFRQAELNGVMLPWEYGGMNLPESIYQMMVELIARAEAGLMTIVGLQEIAVAISEFGDDEMKARVLPRFARGEVAGAMVLTEPDAGSDLGAVQTRATYDAEAGVWRLTGVKRFITNGCADIMVVLARSEEGSNDARGLSLFLVEKDDSVTIRRIESKVGLHASPTCEIQYNNTPAELIGKRRFGLIRYAMALMNGARLAVAAQAVGIAEAAYREAHRYAHERGQFGQLIRDIPAVSRMLLSMRTEIEAARALLYEAARWVDLEKAYEHHIAASAEPEPAARDALKQAARLAATLTPLVKYYATEMGNRVCYQALQVHGGVGYMREFNVERHYRDIRVTNIYEGTSQLQVVAATGRLLAHALDDLLDEWAAQEYGPELAPLKERMLESSGLLSRCVDHLRECDVPLIDYYASDVVDMAVHVVNGWLLLGHARHDERKKAIMQVYIAEHGPKLRSALAAVQAADPAQLNQRELLLSSPF